MAGFLACQRNKSSGQTHAENRPLELGNLSPFAAGADEFSPQSDGTTTAMLDAGADITLKPANSDRTNSWAVQQQLRRL